eukprot:31877-Prorocentrum_minimum.AAC.1
MSASSPIYNRPTRIEPKQYSGGELNSPVVKWLKQGLNVHVEPYLFPTPHTSHTSLDSLEPTPGGFSRAPDHSC